MNSTPSETKAKGQSGFSGEDDTVLVAGGARTGASWLCFMLAHALNARCLEPYCLLRGIVYSGHDYVRALTQGNLPGRSATSCALVVKTHECPDPYFSLTRRLVLITRDPRDMVTSSVLRYQVMRKTGSDIEEDAQDLSLVGGPINRPRTIKERLARRLYGNRLSSVILMARRWHVFHTAWSQIPFCLVVRFEDLVRQPVDEMKLILRHLGIDVPEAQIEETVAKLSMSEIKKHERVMDGSKSIGFRKGIVGDFKNHLSRLELAVIRHFCRDSAARYKYQI